MSQTPPEQFPYSGTVGEPIDYGLAVEQVARPFNQLSDEAVVKDLKPSKIAEIIAREHEAGNLSRADELLDSFCPYGTFEYFFQAKNNARARAKAATTYNELVRAEDFHDEVHNYLRWSKRYAGNITDADQRQKVSWLTGQVESLTDSDMFWPIAAALCRIEGTEIATRYVKQHETFHSSITTALGLLAVYETAKEQELSMPERTHTFARAILQQMPEIITRKQLGEAVHDATKPKRTYLKLA